MAKRALFLDLSCRGLGHSRRCLTLAEGIAQRNPDLSLMVTTGSASMGSLRIPDGIDWTKVPTLQRTNEGSYVGVTPGLSEQELTKMRIALTSELCASYRPDILFIDLLPRAEGHEATTIVKQARRLLPGCKFVLILRDIIDDGDTVVKKWMSYDAYRMMQEHYDRIGIFGCSWIYDAVSEYHFPDALRKKTRYYGYISKWDGKPRPQNVDSDKCGARITVTVGSGVDGLHLITTFLKCLRYLQGDDINALVITGPEMSEKDFQICLTTAQKHTGVHLTRFSKDLHQDIASSKLTISMAGYNTVSEIVECGVRAILVPRGGSNAEQKIRGRRFAELGYVDVIDPEAVDDRSLARQIQVSMVKPQIQRPEITFNGIDLLYDDVVADRNDRFS